MNAFCGMCSECCNIYAHHKQRGQNTNMDKNDKIFTLAYTPLMIK